MAGRVMVMDGAARVGRLMLFLIVRLFCVHTNTGDCALAMRVLYSQENHGRLQVQGVEDPALILPASAYVRSHASAMTTQRDRWRCNHASFTLLALLSLHIHIRAQGGLGPSMFGSRRPPL